MTTQHVSRKIGSNRLSVIILAVWISAFPVSAYAEDVLLGTAKEGTFSHFVGRTLCRIIEKNAGELNCKVLPAPDDIHNLTNLQQGALDMALADSHLLADAVNQTGRFTFMDIRYDNLNMLLPLYDLPVVLVSRADAEITALDQLKGKRINAGAWGSREHQTLNWIMAAKGWTEADFELVEALPESLSQDSMAFCHGSIQAMLNIGVHPDSKMERLLQLCDAVPVNMDDNEIAKMVDGQPALLRIRIPAQIYPALATPVDTFGTTVSLIASGSLDEETMHWTSTGRIFKMPIPRWGHLRLKVHSRQISESLDTREWRPTYLPRKTNESLKTIFVCFICVLNRLKIS